MKKHNEGYVLPLVLVVMVILSLIAVGVMSVSLHNLQTQKAYIERMQDKYEAQGELEKAVANLSSQLEKNVAIDANEIQNVQDKAKVIFLNALGVNLEDSNVKLQRVSPENETVKEPEWTKNAGGAWSCTIFLYATDPEEKIGITCAIYLENVLIPEDGDMVYFYSNPEIIYTSYEIGGVG